MNHKIKLEKYKAIVFDLDDTIYPEIEYLKKAYKYIAKNVLASEKNYELQEHSICEFLINTFQREGRFNLFQKMCSKYQIKNFSIEQFLVCLHNVPLPKRELQVFNKVMRLLNYFKNKKVLFILSNGNIIQQKNKIRSLNLDISIFKDIIYASVNGNEFEKPNPFFLNKIISEHSLLKQDTIFIGDSEIDELTAKNANIEFIYIHDLDTQVL